MVNNLEVGYNSVSSGTYNLSGGSLYAGYDQNLGDSGSGNSTSWAEPDRDGQPGPGHRRQRKRNL